MACSCAHTSSTKFAANAGAGVYAFNTVVAGLGNAVSCDPGNAKSLTASVLSGGNDSCTLANCITTAPAFSPARPYHLTAHLACPTAPSTFPAHDFDGDSRATPLDCGADQLVP